MANFANYGNLETVLTGYAQKINGITEGHTIEGDGVAVTDRDTLNFKDMSVADDSTNLATNVTPHRLTQAELTDILSPLPSAYVNSSLTVDAYNFSTTEKVIGTWIDGKPLYQKTIDCGALPNNTTKHIDTGLNKADVTIVSIDGLSKYDNQYASLPYISSSASWNIMTEANDNSGTSKIYLQVTTTSDWSNGSATVTLQYTKTTDTAVSTGEKIVGTFVDGKPIYQKTIDNGPYGPFESGWFTLAPKSAVSNDIKQIIHSSYTIASQGDINNINGDFVARVFNGNVQMFNGFSDWNGTYITTITLQYTKS